MSESIEALKKKGVEEHYKELKEDYSYLLDEYNELMERYNLLKEILTGETCLDVKAILKEVLENE